MLREQVTLSTRTLLAAIRWEQAEPHPILVDTPVWLDDRARQAADDAARAELRRHKLIDERQRLEPDFDDVLTAIIRPERELYGWINTRIDREPHSYGVLAGLGYREGFVLVREHETDMVVLRAVGRDEFVEGFVAQLPPARPANAHPITVSYADFVAAEATRGPRDGFAGFGRASSPEIQVLKAIFARPRLGAGNLYAAARNRTGTRVRIEHPVNYIDTPEGRWLTLLDAGRGQQWATAIPATPQLIASKLTERAAALAV